MAITRLDWPVRRRAASARSCLRLSRRDPDRAGGIGKTTLALEVARGLLADFDGGGWLVELASLSDPDLVPSAVASVLGLKISGETISAEAVARAIGGQHLLLVLDNCEHVIDAVANLTETARAPVPAHHDTGDEP